MARQASRIPGVPSSEDVAKTIFACDALRQQSDHYGEEAEDDRSEGSDDGDTNDSGHDSNHHDEENNDQDD